MVLRVWTLNFFFMWSLLCRCNYTCYPLVELSRDGTGVTLFAVDVIFRFTDESDLLVYEFLRDRHQTERGRKERRFSHRSLWRGVRVGWFTGPLWQIPFTTDPKISLKSVSRIVPTFGVREGKTSLLLLLRNKVHQSITKTSESVTKRKKIDGDGLGTR